MRTFIGMNIRGFPPMRTAAVARDLRTAMDNADVLVAQEFGIRRYWRKAQDLMFPNGWSSYPSYAKGIDRPRDSAQPVMWKRDKFKLIGVRRNLLMRGVAKIANTRFLRAALLEDRETGDQVWYGTTHFVVKGDRSNHPQRRRRLLNSNIRRLVRLIEDLKETGHPIIFQLDANIHKGTDTHKRFTAIIHNLGGTFHGEQGVEFTFTIPGKTQAIKVEKAWRIPVDKLATDHEARCINYSVVKRAGKK